MNSLIVLGMIPVFLTTSQAQTWDCPVREIPVPSLGDVAMASVDTLGFVIYYNPTAIKMVGSLTADFFRIHEYGHIYLGHLANMMLARDRDSRLWISRKAEIEADEYATRVLAKSNPLVITAIISQFKNFPHPGDSTHLPSIERADNIRTLFDNITKQNLDAGHNVQEGGVNDRVKSTASKLLQHLASENFYSVTMDLNDELNNILSSQQIKQVWNQVTTQLGTFKRYILAEEKKMNAHTQLVIRCRFERGDAQMEIKFDDEGKIGGLWIRPLNE